MCLLCLTQFQPHSPFFLLLQGETLFSVQLSRAHHSLSLVCLILGNMADAAAESVRPWTAEIPTHLGTKAKYNLSLMNDGEVTTPVLPMGVTGVMPVRSPSTRALKERWAQETTPVVEQPPPTPKQPPPTGPMIQVRRQDDLTQINGTHGSNTDARAHARTPMHTSTLDAFATHPLSMPVSVSSLAHAVVFCRVTTRMLIQFGVRGQSSAVRERREESGRLTQGQSRRCVRP